MNSREITQPLDRLQLSRLLTEVENDTPAGREALDQSFTRSGRAHLIGVTGAPGTGKSSLVNCIARIVRRDLKKTVAIVAVDPSSPFTGGAILGDRVRMRDLAGDEGVFIRSMASRGALGGLARSTAGVTQILDTAGYDWIMIETVGAGQSEVDIARLAHTTLVIESPGMGDDIQAIKAGIMEIADILVINKADLPGTENTERALRANLDLGYSSFINNKQGHKNSDTVRPVADNSWKPPILKTIATQMTGIEDLVSAITDHQEYLVESGLLQERNCERLRTEFDHQVQARLMQKWNYKNSDKEIDQVLQDVFNRKCSPGQAADLLISKTSL